MSEKNVEVREVTCEQIEVTLESALALLPKEYETDVHTVDASMESYPVGWDIRYLVGSGSPEFEVTVYYCHPSIEPRELVGVANSTAIRAVLAAVAFLAKENP